MTVSILIKNHRTLSWNKLYAQRHWAVRKQLVDSIHGLVISTMMEEDIKKYGWKKASIEVEACAKRPVDPDNIALKPYLDAIRRYGLIIDDTYQVIQSITCRSKKAKEESLFIRITKLE